MTLDFQKILQFFLILAYFWPNHWYLEERNGFVHVLLVPINDKYWVIVNSRSKDLAKWQKMSENCFLKGKNGQFYIDLERTWFEVRGSAIFGGSVGSKFGL